MSKGYIIGVIMTIIGFLSLKYSDWFIVSAIIFSIGFALILKDYGKKKR